MFKQLKGHLQGAYVIHTSSVGKQNEAPDVTFRLVCTVLGSSCMNVLCSLYCATQ